MNLPKLNLSQISCPDNPPPESPSLDYEDPEIKDMAILFQYKLMQLYGPQLGIYVVPEIHNTHTWHCIIFLRHGFYKDSKFKFTVEFTQQFPIERPIIRFSNKVHHPLVEFPTGTVDMEALVPNWDYSGNEMMYTVFKNLSNMFIDKTILSVGTSFNPPIAHLYRTSPTQFMQKVIESIQDSQLSFTKNLPSSALIINYSHWEQRTKIKDQLKRIMDEEEDFLGRKGRLMDYIMHV